MLWVGKTDETPTRNIGLRGVQEVLVFLISKEPTNHFGVFVGV